MGTDQYPKSLQEAVDVLSNHHFDFGYNNRRRERSQEPERPEAQNEDGNETRDKKNLVKCDFKER